MNYAVLLALVAAVAGRAPTSLAAEIDLSKLPPASTRKGLTYAQDIRPLFEASCLRCHGEERPRGDLRLDTLEATLQGGESGAGIVPGNSAKSTLVHAIAQIDDETAMPPKRRERGPGGEGRGRDGGPGRGEGRGGPGGERRGFGPGMMLAPQLLSQGDKNGDSALSQQEFAALAEAWFAKLDTDHSGKLTQEQFAERLASLLPAPEGGPGGGGRGGRGFGPARFLGPGLFTAVDGNQDGSLTQAELKQTFSTWSSQWDEDKQGTLSADEIRDGLNKTLPRPNFGGRGGPGGPGGQGGPGGPGGVGGFGPPPAPLTAEEVGLVRAWIDQGAK